MTVVKKQKPISNYNKFNQIDGSHPLKKILPEGYVDYPARIRRDGKVAYFNFELAKEMGLISKSHDDQLNKDLINMIIETFGIQIINEFDQMNGRKFKSSDMKSGTYMATRYLQMQHDDKKGLNSGDGRSIWLGNIRNQGKQWDLSACGTGATRLSPATSKYNKFFETGDPTISYGCGYAELDEGLATSFMSYIFNKNDIRTEQTLCVIEYKNDLSINVRVHENLLRPSHFFLYLKQDNLDALERITNYYIDRNSELESWADCPKTKNKRYDYLLNKVVDDFATISANFEDEYIFCWLDWDGDNILMDGGIIDYGSIRQFGLLHHEYKYDDVERYSTSILEQKSKAKYMVQNFIQIIDYLKSGEKKALNDFADDKALDEFENIYELRKKENILKRVGFSPKKAKQLIKRESSTIESFQKVFSYFEKAKTKQGIVEVSDGKTCDAIFNMRNILRDLPQVLLASQRELTDDEFIEIIASAFATEEDLEMTSYRKAKIKEFQKLYRDLVDSCARIFQESVEDTLLSISTRSQFVNKPNRITGDAVTHIVNLIMQQRKNLSPEEIHSILQDLAITQNTNPDQRSKKILTQSKSKLLAQILNIIKENREGI